MRISDSSPYDFLNSLSTFSKPAQLENINIEKPNMVSDSQTVSPSNVSVQNTENTGSEVSVAMTEEAADTNKSSFDEKGSTFSSYDYAKQYEPDKKFSLVGSASSTADLDIERAISDMKKDGIIQQYNYFVKSPKASGGGSNTPPENFDLF